MPPTYFRKSCSALCNGCNPNMPTAFINHNKCSESEGSKESDTLPPPLQSEPGFACYGIFCFTPSLSPLK